MSEIVTRFAPSPTGYLHVGGARTAIFSWLLARSQGGKFLLRIEDTDRERSTPEATQAILEGMAWLGLSHDGELVYQSERGHIHNAAVDAMLEAGTAYWCECTPEEVEAMREKARAEGRKPKYDGRCRERGLGPGPGRVVRLKAPLDGATSYDDMVKGPISVANEEMDDLILRRSDGSPTYNLAVVVDDSDMGVTHVLRGEDHISNTPRQIQIYRALGLATPRFGHVPMILGPDKKKLSKRHGATAVVEYDAQGILPEAMLNYLARLGWSHGDQEIFSREDLVRSFTIENLGTSAAVFDMDKLLWLNSHFIKESSPERLADMLPRHFEALSLPVPEREALLRVIPHYQPRAKTLVEFVRNSAFFFVADDALIYDQAAVAKFLTPEARERLAQMRGMLAALPDFGEETVERALGEYVESSGASFKVIAQPLRVAVTGSTQSPGLHQTLAALGRDKTLARLDRALKL